MPIPDFVVALRQHVGHALLWMPGITAVVTRSEGRDRQVLLVQRSDNDEWTPVTGIVDPGEQPHLCAVREVWEETRVVAEVERLVWVRSSGVVEHVNGDLAQYLDHTFACRWISGEPEVGDDESTQVRWWPLGRLPPMRQIFIDRIATATAASHEVRLG